MQWWIQDSLQLRRRSGLRSVAESLQHVVRRHLLVLRLLQWHSNLPVQPRLGFLPLREHQRRRVHHLHQRRQEVLRDDPGMLRLHRRLLVPTRLLLLHLVQEHAGLLRQLLSAGLVLDRRNPFRQPSSQPLGAVFFCAPRLKVQQARVSRVRLRCARRESARRKRTWLTGFTRLRAERRFSRLNGQLPH